MNERIVKQLVRMQKQYARIYNPLKHGLCGVSERGVQITEQAFAALMDGREYRVRKHSEEIPYIAELDIDGVRFFTIGTADEFAAVNIPTYREMVNAAYMEPMQGE